MMCHQTLIIDPVLSYSTYLGGSNSEFGSGIAVDASGNAYVTGVTDSPNSPSSIRYLLPIAHCRAPKTTSKSFAFNPGAFGPE
jgi:Beta-propeller repeat